MVVLKKPRGCNIGIIQVSLPVRKASDWQGDIIIKRPV
jgi:hypothetical protein